MKKCLIPPDQLETLASDREAWKDVCEEGLAAFNDCVSLDGFL